jgi:hypothetical protein
MLFNLKQIKDAVDIVIGDDGFRGDEVVETLKQEYLAEERERQHHDLGDERIMKHTRMP